jgi:hypothetical protein
MATRPHPLEWVADPFKERADYERRSMFGCQSIYLRGRTVLAVAAKQEPWNGLLCPTERKYHDSLRQDYPALTAHPILPKWLYLSADQDAFEITALEIVGAILGGDRRFGIEPQSKRRSGSKKR